MQDSVGRVWKLGLIVSVGLAWFSFFVPFIEIRFASSTVPVSAYRIVVGFDDIGQFDPALRDLPETAHDKLKALNRSIRHVPFMIVGEKLRAGRIPNYYLSPAVLLVVAAIVLARRRLGFLGALFTITGGLGAVWGWNGEPMLDAEMIHAGMSAQLAWGATLFLVAGALALIAGIGALLCWDPGGFRARPTITALLRRGEGPIAIDMPTAQENAKVPTATLRRPSARSDAKHRS